MPRLLLALLMISSLLLLLNACPEVEPVAPVDVPTAQERSAKEDLPHVRSITRVILPDEVAGHWQGVKIAVFNKSASREEVLLVPLGGQVDVPDSVLRLEARTFLPAFVMEGTLITSSSNALSNPAVEIAILEGKKVLFKGWLFSRYPGTHAFQHPQFSFTLIDFVPTP